MMNRLCMCGIVILLVVAGCEKKASDEVDPGTVENSVYHNKYFGLSVTLPTDWIVQDKAAFQELASKGSELIAGDDKELKSKLERASQSPRTMNLLTVFKHPMGSPVAFNPSMVWMIEQVRHAPGVRRGKDYHFHTRKALESSQLSVTFSKEEYTESLSGVDFDVMPVVMTVSGQNVRQKHYATITKGYALTFAVSFTTPEEEAELDAVLKTIRFDP